MSKSTIEIRQAFLDFFYSKGHKIVVSSSLVPNNDPTLLFTNAGMNQFKNVFLGLDRRDYSCATTSQRCVRAGGKHNDLENVGYTSQHHTFFEMLGNFSFGKYFKHEAIQYAWELLTSKNWFNLPKERLKVTVHKTDNESYEIWEKEVGIPRERIIRIGDNKGRPYESDNFWQMGDTGPCGPCTEIFYDCNNHNEDRSINDPKKDSEHCIEIWNIVFMQFNRQANGIMEPLLQPSVDTGMGLERIAAVIQHVNSNYDIDLFRKLITSVAQITGTTNLSNKSLRVIADHIRSCAFLIADGVIPSNEGRGYVLRRIIRRAIRHGNMLGVRETFFYKLVEPLIEVMDIAGEDLKRQRTQVEQILKIEEEQFACTLERGLTILNEKLANLSGKVLDGETAFRLYDTYGFPIDLTSDICRERNIKVDESGFDVAMEKQRCRARRSSNFGIDHNAIFLVRDVSEFQGYNCLELNNSNVINLLSDNNMVCSIRANQEAVVILDKTPFYAESCGQVGDQGELKGNKFKFIVRDTQRYNQAIGHIGKLEFGDLKIGDVVQAQVDKSRRNRICLNHSATHLMYAALREVLGTHVMQKGSLINDKILRFDFLHFKAMKPLEIRTVENIVNTQIRRNLPIETNVMDLELIKEKGIISLFNKKYDKLVRVLNIGNISIEPCNGTHALFTGDLGLFYIVSESSVAAGVRRIEAVVGENAVINLHTQRDQLCDIAQLLKSNNQNLDKKVHNILKRNRQLEKEIKQLKGQIVIQKSENLSNKAVNIKGVKLIVSELFGVEPKMLRSIVNILQNQFSSSVIVLATVVEGKVSLIAGVSKNITDRVRAGELIDIITQKIGGGNKGGKDRHPDIAQSSGANASALPTALTSIENWINARL